MNLRRIFYSDGVFFILNFAWKKGANLVPKFPLFSDYGANTKLDYTLRLQRSRHDKFWAIPNNFFRIQNFELTTFWFSIQEWFGWLKIWLHVVFAVVDNFWASYLLPFQDSFNQVWQLFVHRKFLERWLNKLLLEFRLCTK